MTCDALIHIPGFVRQPVQVLNSAVALLTGYLFVDMPLMVEQDMLSQVVDFSPGGRGVRVEIFMFLLNPWVPFNDVVVAVQALLHRRHSRKIGVGHIWVAILALNLFDTTMDVVTERYGLFRGCNRTRAIEEIKKENDCQARKHGKEQRPPVTFQRQQKTAICKKLICHYPVRPGVNSGNMRKK
jgi:hypothetical protein